MGPDEIFETLRNMESQFSSSCGLLLCHDDEVRMTPALTLPYPKWMTEAHLLIPAAEIWGDYHHPVLTNNLYSLAQRFAGQPWGEFYAQGRELLTRRR